MILICLRCFRVWLDWYVYAIEHSGIDTPKLFHAPTSIGLNGIGDFPANFVGC